MTVKLHVLSDRLVFRRSRRGMGWALTVLGIVAGGVALEGRMATAEPLSIWQQVAARDQGRAKARKSKRRAATRPAPARPAEAAAALKVLTRKDVLAADPAALERIGRHIVIGYHAIGSVRALVEKKAIAGIFITDHNVRRRKAADVRAEIDALQAIRAAQGLPALIVAADQEGGAVSRLSPPLQRQQGLAKVISKLPKDGDLKEAVKAYARLQAAELARIGVNLNFAPVVDLRIDPKRRSDGETRLRDRALSDDPKLVADVAGWYCDALAESGIRCTLKHFPGLGRVTLDTHRKTGDIATPILELNGADFVPFRQLMDRPHVVTMLAHVRIRDLDKEHPASFSEPVIRGLLRGEWRHNGLVITDDFSMGAVTRSPEGVGPAAVKSLNAGADLVLVSFSDKHLNAVMTALLEADAKGEIDAGIRAESTKRLSETTFGEISGEAVAAPVP